MAGKGKPFDKDNPGRPLGSKNKRTRALDAITKAGLDPFEYLASVVADKRAKKDHRIACAKELCEYLEPKLSRTEVETGDDNAQRGFLLIPIATKAKPK